MSKTGPDTQNIPFFAQGLAFSCCRCSRCCRFDPGYVFLSQKDVDRLVLALGMEYTDFTKTFCRWIPSVDSREQLSLREKSNNDCIFWDEGCRVYEARPLQCRTFPFWHSVLSSRESWEAAGVDCPGIGSGEIRDLSHIESCLAQREEEPVIMRKSR